MAVTLLFTHIAYTHIYLQNNYIMMQILLCEFCPQDVEQTTFKMFVFRMKVQIDQGSPES